MHNQLFDYAYNDPNAKTNFTLYYNTIDNRANFFGVNDNYQGVDVNWFNIAEQVSRGDLEGVDFWIANALSGSNLYAWRNEAGDALMYGGFDNFKNLCNNQSQNSLNWDSNQLMSEQKLLQPIHEKYLNPFSNHTWVMIGGNFLINRFNLLNLNSRIEYGCQQMGYKYNKIQGCK